MEEIKFDFNLEELSCYLERPRENDFDDFYEYADNRSREYDYNEDYREAAERPDGFSCY